MIILLIIIYFQFEITIMVFHEFNIFNIYLNPIFDDVIITINISLLFNLISVQS